MDKQLHLFSEEYTPILKSARCVAQTCYLTNNKTKIVPMFETKEVKTIINNKRAAEGYFLNLDNSSLKGTFLTDNNDGSDISNSEYVLNTENFSPNDSSVTRPTSEDMKIDIEHNTKDVNYNSSATTPETPSNMSNSISLSEEKADFLIDDEIADQPALILHDNFIGRNDSRRSSESAGDDFLSSSKWNMIFKRSIFNNKDQKFLSNRADSLGNLSQCESMASEDLIMDYDSLSQSSGPEDCESNVVVSNETIARPNFFHSEDNISLSTRESYPMRTNNIINNSAQTTKLNYQLNSTHESLQQTCVNNTDIMEDVVTIKSMLVKLTRILNELEAHNPLVVRSSMSLDTISYKSETPELEELHKQVFYLQGQLEDSEKTVEILREQIKDLSREAEKIPSPKKIACNTETCNAATQTERGLSTSLSSYRWT